VHDSSRVFLDRPRNKAPDKFAYHLGTANSRRQHYTNCPFSKAERDHRAGESSVPRCRNDVHNSYNPHDHENSKILVMMAGLVMIC